MTRQSTDTCASCAKFDINRALEHQGLGYCSGYEREQHYTGISVLYVRDTSNLDARRRAVKRLMESEPK